MRSRGFIFTVFQKYARISYLSFRSEDFADRANETYVIYIKRNNSCIFQQLRYGSNRTCIAKIGREKYCRMYPTTIVNSDGSSYTIRYHEPRKIINLPLYTADLTADELQKHLDKKKPKEKVIIEEQMEDDFDLDRYSHLWESKDKK